MLISSAYETRQNANFYLLLFLNIVPIHRCCCRGTNSKWRWLEIERILESRLPNIVFQMSMESGENPLICSCQPGDTISLSRHRRYADVISIVCKN